MSFHEEYCAFSQIRGNANLATLSMTCTMMDTKSSAVKGLRRIAPRILEIETRDGPYAGAKQTLHKCPINFTDPKSDPSTPSNMDKADEEYFDRMSDEANQILKETMYNLPQPSGRSGR
jgi:hypothetical protein